MIDSTEIAAPRLLARKILFPGGLAMALSLAGDLTLYAVLPAYAAGLGISLAAVGVLLSANRLIRLVSNPLVGALADRFNRRRLVLLGLTTGVFSTLLYSAADGFWLFLLGRLLWGISWSILYIGLYAMVLDVTGPSERGWSSGLLQTFYFAGLAVNPLLGGILSDRLGFDQAMLVCAAIQGLGLLAALLFLPDTHPAPAEAGPVAAGAASPGVRPVGERLRALVRRDLRERLLFFRDKETLAANGLYMLTLFIGDGIIMSTITLYLQQRYGDQIPFGGAGLLPIAALPVAAAGGLLIALRAVISAGGAPFAGRLADRAGARWGAAGAGAALTVAGCVLLGLDGSFWIVLGGIGLASFGSGMLMAVLPVIVSGAGGAKSGFSLGLLITSGDVGCAVAPLVSYAVLGVLSLSQIYLISAALLAAGGLLAWAGRGRRGRR